MKIEIFNFELVSKDYDFKGIVIDTFVEAILFAFPEFKNDLNIIFVEEVEIRRLNSEFRKKDSVTDVLSFKAAEGMDKDEIYICSSFILSSVKSNACTADLVSGRLFLIEVLRMISHGILHINNYTHEGYFDGGFDLRHFDKTQRSQAQVTESMFVEQERRLRVIIDKLEVK